MVASAVASGATPAVPRAATAARPWSGRMAVMIIALAAPAAAGETCLDAVDTILLGKDLVEQGPAGKKAYSTAVVTADWLICSQCPEGEPV